MAPVERVELEPLPSALAEPCQGPAVLPEVVATWRTWERVAIANGVRLLACGRRHADTVEWGTARDEAVTNPPPLPGPKPGAVP